MATSQETLNSIVDKRYRDIISFIQQKFSYLRNHHEQYHTKVIDKIRKLQIDNNITPGNDHSVVIYQHKIKTQYDILSELMNDDIKECELTISQNLNRDNQSHNHNNDNIEGSFESYIQTQDLEISQFIMT